MRLKVLAAVSFIAVAVSGCTNDTLDNVGVDVKKVSNKTQYQLSGQVVSKMASLNIDRNAPVMLRIFKEEGTLEVWKSDRSNRFQMIKTYQICAWSGKLGPKVKEGDRQAPEGFYPLSPQHMNPNSQYYLAINTGFPNTYDRANGASGSHLMIHGACSSSGCYSMTDEQMIEIFAFARDAFKGGQKAVQLQAFPFRMTAENMARHRDNPNIEFWKMLKVGYDHFQVTKRPPEVAVCDKRYVFNQQGPGGAPFAGAAQCPAISTPAQLQVAMSSFDKSFAAEYAKAMKKYDGTVWLEPSEAQRKAIVADKRKGRELAYAPTGSSIDAGKLMTVRQIEAEKKKAEDEAARKIEMAEKARQEQEDRKAAELQKLADDVAAQKAAQETSGTTASIAVPSGNPGPTSPEAEAEAARQPFWKRWSSKGTVASGASGASATTAATVPARPADDEAGNGGSDAAATARVPKPAQPAKTEADAATQAAQQPGTPSAAPGEQQDGTADAGTQAPPPAAATADASAAPKQPFWKFWKKQ